MVLGATVLPDYWGEIKAILSSASIIGHNICYHLKVISKSLDRYDLAIPNFEYVCRLKMSQKLMKEPSYKLSSLSEKIGYRYQHHHALEDAEAANRLFEYMIKSYGPESVIPERFQYERRMRENIDPKLAANINDFQGIINGITSDGIVVDKEIKYLYKWIDENVIYRVYSLFDRIIREFDLILEDGVVSEYERQELMALTDSITQSKIYSENITGARHLTYFILD